MSIPDSRILPQAGTASWADPSAVGKNSRTAKETEIAAIYSQGAQIYDKLNRIMSLGSGHWYRRRALRTLGLDPEARVIDLACGTGALAIAAQEAMPLSPSILAIDPHPEMRRLAAAAGAVDVRDGSFQAIPASTAKYDAVVSGYALRYAEPRVAAFHEIRRVLRPGGQLLLLEMIVPPNGFRRALAKLFLCKIGAPFCSLLCRNAAAGALLVHLWQNVSSLEGPRSIIRDLETAGFRGVEYHHVIGLLGEFRAHTPSGSPEANNIGRSVSPPNAPLQPDAQHSS